MSPQLAKQHAFTTPGETVARSGTIISLDRTDFNVASSLALACLLFCVPTRLQRVRTVSKAPASRADSCLMVWRKRLSLAWFLRQPLATRRKKIGGHAVQPFYEHPQMPLQAVLSQWGRKCWRSFGRVEIQATLCTPGP